MNNTTEITMPTIIRVQDKHNHDKTHYFKFYKCQSVYYNQAINGQVFYSRYSRVFMRLPFGYDQYLAEAKNTKPSYIKGKKIVLSRDGWLYAIYASDIHHLYCHEGGRWRRMKAPARNHKCAVGGNTNIGDIFETLQAIAKQQ
jgi:hypothetical protein